MPNVSWLTLDDFLFSYCSISSILRYKTTQIMWCVPKHLILLVLLISFFRHCLPKILIKKKSLIKESLYTNDHSKPKKRVSLFAISDRLKLLIMCEWHELNIRGAEGLDKSWPLRCCLREYNYYGSVQGDVTQTTDDRFVSESNDAKNSSADLTLLVVHCVFRVLIVLSQQYADHISDGVSGWRWPHAAVRVRDHV